MPSHTRKTSDKETNTMHRTGIGSVCQAGLQNAWGTPATPDTLINMTGETIKVTVNKGDEGNLLAKKTRDQADVMPARRIL